MSEPQNSITLTCTECGAENERPLPYSMVDPDQCGSCGEAFDRHDPEDFANRPNDGGEFRTHGESSVDDEEMPATEASDVIDADRQLYCHLFGSLTFTQEGVLAGWHDSAPPLLAIARHRMRFAR